MHAGCCTWLLLGPVVCVSRCGHRPAAVADHGAGPVPRELRELHAEVVRTAHAAQQRHGLLLRVGLAQVHRQHGLPRPAGRGLRHRGRHLPAMGQEAGREPANGPPAWLSSSSCLSVLLVVDVKQASKQQPTHSWGRSVVEVWCMDACRRGVWWSHRWTSFWAIAAAGPTPRAARAATATSWAWATTSPGARPTGRQGPGGGRCGCNT